MILLFVVYTARCTACTNTVYSYSGVCALERYNNVDRYNAVSLSMLLLILLFMANRRPTYGRAYSTRLCLLSVCDVCIVAKRYVVDRQQYR